MDYILFLLSAIIVVGAGVKLSEYGDALAAVTGIGRSFIGITLLALFTSLPELISTIGALTLVDNPDLAFGNVYGSNMFNMLTIFLLDAYFRKTDIYNGISESNILTALYASLVTAFSVLGFYIKVYIGSVSVVTLIIVVLFFYSSYVSYKVLEKDEDEEEETDMTLKGVIFRMGIAALAIVFAGLMLSKTADSIAVLTGLGGSFVGSFFLAVVTSLPEVATCYGAIRVGSVNMALGNLFGSNLFNIAIIPFADFVYIKGPIFNYVSKGHITGAIFATIAILIPIIGIRERNFRLKVFGVSFHSYSLVVLYVIYSAYFYLVR
ncbi:MAG: sodium:calcium antiporter [Denitrovibrio sp.]|nr:MAG: sodium:calcium antiporter [Denitrovibrio sp.]